MHEIELDRAGGTLPTENYQMNAGLSENSTDGVNYGASDGCVQASLGILNSNANSENFSGDNLGGQNNLNHEVANSMLPEVDQRSPTFGLEAAEKHEIDQIENFSFSGTQAMSNQGAGSASPKLGPS